MLVPEDFGLRSVSRHDRPINESMLELKTLIHNFSHDLSSVLAFNVIGSITKTKRQMSCQRRRLYTSLTLQETCGQRVNW